MATAGRGEEKRGVFSRSVSAVRSWKKTWTSGVSGVFVGLFLLGSVGGPVAGVGSSQTFETEYVVLVCVDGIRNSEGLKSAEATPLGEFPAQHPYMPRLWSEIAPFATHYLNCKNVEMTFTTPGFNTILSGTWQAGPNRSRRDDGGFFDNRSHEPTVFEYFSQAKSGTSWAVINKKNTLLSDFSLHPLYGHNANTNVVFIDPGRGASRYVSDAEVYAEAVRVVDEEQPKFLFVNFGSVDLGGHSRAFSIYTEAIRNADIHVADLWAHIQAHPLYQGKTTMILTTDHGRHTDHRGGFTGHGGMCDGCRDLFSLVIGPDTPEGLVVNRRTYQTDFAPTVGRLLGFKTPLATGRAMEEALGCPSAEDVLDQRGPKIVSDGSSVFIGYTRTRHGKQEIHTAISRDAGATFTQDINHTPFKDESSYAKFAKDPCLLVNRRNAKDLLHAVWMDLNDVEGRWQMRHQLADLSSFQSGSRLIFEPQKVIGLSVFEGERQIPTLSNAGLIMRSPSLISARGPNGRREIVATSGLRYSLGFRFSDQGFPARESGNILAAFPEERYFFAEPRLVAGEGMDVYLVWRDIFESSFADINGDTAVEPLFNWEVYFSVSHDGGESWSNPAERLTNTSGPSLFPRVAYVPYGGVGNGPQVISVYSEPDENGIFQVVMRRGVFGSGSEGNLTFGDPEVVTDSSVGAWYPEIFLDRPISGNRLHLVYTDFEHGQGDVMYRFAPEGTFFAPPINLSESEDISQKPSITVLDDKRKVVAWEEIDSDGVSTLGTKVFRAGIPEAFPRR